MGENIESGEAQEAGSEDELDAELLELMADEEEDPPELDDEEDEGLDGAFGRLGPPPPQQQAEPAAEGEAAPAEPAPAPAEGSAAEEDA